MWRGCPGARPPFSLAPGPALARPPRVRRDRGPCVRLPRPLPARGGAWPGAVRALGVPSTPCAVPRSASSRLARPWRAQPLPATWRGRPAWPDAPFPHRARPCGLPSVARLGAVRGPGSPARGRGGPPAPARRARASARPWRGPQLAHGGPAQSLRGVP
jgi:hypothetical protein